MTIAPVVASYAAYYLFPRDAQANYGELLPTRPAPEIAGTALDGAQFRVTGLTGKWVLAMAAPGGCDAACQQQLYATRQARMIQGREMDRVTRVWFVTDDAPPPPALLAQHPDVVAVRVPAGALAAWGKGADRIYVVDPLGNLVLAFPRDPDIKAMAKDLTRLLKASRIG
ncbi:MAG: cytochrome C oxidase subunit I [Betaproteobacteria bacterium]|nr:cytochrome C oxidase subunit I [Betaproteobacteria bacterium]